MSWLRRLSRDRGSRADQDMPSRAFVSSTVTGPGDYGSPTYKDTQYSNGFSSPEKIQSSYRPTTANDQGYNATPRALPSGADTPHRSRVPPPAPLEPTPDPLKQAFNEALRPYIDQLEDLKAEVEYKNQLIQQLEDERADMHAWIDKRGLRADVPPSIAKAMNGDPAAAQTLNYQLDRKMTVLNHDLHRLQDSLPSHLPTATFTNTLIQLIPAIEDLAALPHNGPALAFELVIKLGGNLNSHVGEEGYNNDADIRSRADFYGKLDECMQDIVLARLQAQSAAEGGGGGGGGGGEKEDPPWHIGRDVKRLEKTGAFLKSKLGLQGYFPRSLALMKRSEIGGGPGNGVAVSGSE